MISTRMNGICQKIDLITICIGRVLRESLGRLFNLYLQLKEYVSVIVDLLRNECVKG